MWYYMNILCGVELIHGSIYEVKLDDGLINHNSNYYIVFERVKIATRVNYIVCDLYDSDMQLIRKKTHLVATSFHFVKLLYNLFDSF